MSDNVLDFSKGKRKGSKQIKPTTNVMQGPKKVGLPCRVCDKKHEKYIVVQALIAGVGQPQALPLMVCPDCGHVFVPQEVLDKIKKAL